jgi:hypothetical protein
MASPAPKPAMGGAGGGAGSPAFSSPGGKGGPLLNVVAAGTKGIDELATKVDPSTVTFALCRIVLGSGSLARDKCIGLHISPGERSAVGTLPREVGAEGQRVPRPAQPRSMNLEGARCRLP